MGDNPRAQLAAALLLLEKCGKLFAGLLDARLDGMGK